MRYIIAICYISGQNADYKKYTINAAHYRRSLFKATTPRNYRILGSGWTAALGHVCNLDFYLKFLQLHVKNDVRIVLPYIPHQQIGDAGKFLLTQFSERGIHVIPPDELENDYNLWANKNHHPQWNALTHGEKAALVDDCWDMEFNDGEILPFTHAHVRIQNEWEAANKEPLFKLSSSEKQWLSDYLLNLGVPNNTWYVCLHVREPGYHRSWDNMYTSTLDANILDYHLAIEEIIKAGGWVIRMGDPSMKPLPKRHGVIDYAHHPARSAQADVLLAAGCRFLLTANSGFLNICSMYHVPCLLTNFAPIGTPPALKHDLLMPKLYRNHDTNHYLTLEEMFKSEIAYIMNSSNLPSNISCIANTPEELAQVTVEMLLQWGTPDSNTAVKPGVSDAIQDYFDNIARTYNGFTSARLSRVFYNKHRKKIFKTDNALTMS